MARDPQDSPRDTDPDSTTDRATVLELAKQRFKVAREDTEEQRERESDDLAFDAGDQWTDEVKEMRRGTDVHGAAIPDRPMLTIPKLDQPVALVINQMKAAHLGIQIHPVSEDADDDTAEIIQGLIRSIEVKSRANLARAWAFERAAKCGFGAYRILTEPCTDYPPDSEGPEVFDQDIVIKRILNQANVYLDPHAQEPDWSDGEWAFVVERMPEEKYKRLYGDSKLAKFGQADWDTLGDEATYWTDWDEGNRTIQVAEYFVVVTEMRTKVALKDGRVGWKDELGDIAKEDIRQEREIETRTVRWYKLNAIEVLDEQEWNGRYIPIIPVIGREQNIDGDRRFVGIIGPAKDAQRLFNYSVSQAVEAAALEPKVPYIGVEGQFAGNERKWETANSRNHAYLEYRAVSLDGKPAPPPQRNVSVSPNVGVSLQLVQQADDYIKAATFAFDPSLGNTSSARSGKAVLALQQQADAGNSHYLDNLSSISMTYEARVILDLIPNIYDRKGRIARIRGLDDEESSVILNAPYTEQNGRPQPLPPGTPPPQKPSTPIPPQPGQPPSPMAAKPVVKHYDLRKGVYMTTVSVGKSYQTKLQQGADALGQMLQAMPQLFPALGWRWAKYSDYPGHNEVAEDLKKLRPKELQDQETADPKQMQAQLAQMQQQGQMQQQQLQQAVEMIRTKQVEQQAKIQVEQVSAQKEITIQRMKDATAIAVAKINALSKGVIADNEAQVEAIALAHESELAAHDRAHEVGLEALAHQQALQQGQQGQDHAIEQQMLQPPPMPPSNNGGGEQP